MFSMSDTQQRRQLLRAGMCLFFLGILLSVPLPFYVNGRMALAAHLEGTMNGMFLAIVGLLWNDLRLSAKAKTVAFLCGICGAYANWLATFLSAIWGASHLSPIAGAGFRALPWQELFVRILLQVFTAPTDVLCVALLVWGLREHVKPGVNT